MERLKTENIANFSKALTKAFDLLDSARVQIARTERTRLLCQCHYLHTDNHTSIDREEFCPTDLNCKV